MIETYSKCLRFEPLTRNTDMSEGELLCAQRVKPTLSFYLNVRHSRLILSSWFIIFIQFDTYITGVATLWSTFNSCLVGL